MSYLPSHGYLLLKILVQRLNDHPWKQGVNLQFPMAHAPSRGGIFEFTSSFCGLGDVSSPRAIQVKPADWRGSNPFGFPLPEWHKGAEKRAFKWVVSS